MLFDRIIHHAILANSLVNGWEKLSFLVMVMLRDTVVPGQAIAHKIETVGCLYSWSLLIDTVEAADEGIVAQGHVGGFDGERVRLVMFFRAVDRVSLRRLTLPVSNFGVCITASGVSLYSGGGAPTASGACA